MKLEFRKAGTEDVIGIGRLMRDLVKEQDLEPIYGVQFDYESALIAIDDCVRHGFCIVGPTSCAGGFMAPFPFNCEAIIGNVLFWNFRNARECVIFDHLTEAFREAGCTHVNVATHFPRNRGASFFRRRGFQAAETQYLGAIDKCCKKG